MDRTVPLFGLLLFPFAMFLLLVVGLGLATVVDSSIWVPRPFGMGYTLDWSKPLSWLLLIYTLGIVLLVVYAAIYPDAPGIRTLIQLLSSLTSSS